jgi:hypothetical protein
MKTWIKYGLINALLGLIIGIYITITATGEGYFLYGISAPIAAFLTGGLIWKLIVKDKFDRGKIIITGLLTGTISHYLAFLLVSILMNICYWTTGMCTGSLGEPPASIFSMLIGSFAFLFFSLLFFGWITVPYSLITGFILKKIENNKQVA